jgi:hypothetical protein
MAPKGKRKRGAGTRAAAGGGGAGAKKKRKKKKGKKKGKTRWRSFGEARAWARGLGLANQKAWYRHKQRPADIPSVPEKVFKHQGWAGYGDWLGTGNESGGRPSRMRPFAAARAFARSLHLSGAPAWKLWCRTHAGERPRDVPTNPHTTYAGNGWVSWPDFLGNQPDEGEECSICLEPFPKAIQGFAKLRGCGHRFHRPCIAEWREVGNGTCPKCRADLLDENGELCGAATTRGGLCKQSVNCPHHGE